MLGLSIHTSSPELGLALSNFADQTRHQVWPLGRDLSSYLHTCLSQFIQPYAWSNLSFLAVAQGPGGFTGTRMGVVTARTLAQQLAIPLFGISSLAAMAQFWWDQHPIQPQSAAPLIAVEMRAQRGDKFVALYQPVADQVQCQLADQVMTPAAWEDLLSTQIQPVVRVMAEAGLAHTAPQVLTLAYSHWQRGKRPLWSETVPYYGQHPVD